MNTPLTPELENSVKAEVASSLQNNASKVICKFFTPGEESQWLAREAAGGYKQLHEGQTIEVKSMQHFIDLIRA